MLPPARRCSGASPASRSYWGMLVAHVGIGVFVLGVTMVKGTETTNDVNMRAGDTTSISGYTFRLNRLENIKGPNYTAIRGTFDVARGNDKPITMAPEKLHVYRAPDADD